jgi:hypothetical protein
MSLVRVSDALVVAWGENVVGATDLPPNRSPNEAIRF